MIERSLRVLVSPGKHHYLLSYSPYKLAQIWKVGLAMVAASTLGFCIWASL